MTASLVFSACSSPGSQHKKNDGDLFLLPNCYLRKEHKEEKEKKNPEVRHDTCVCVCAHEHTEAPALAMKNN